MGKAGKKETRIRQKKRQGFAGKEAQTSFPGNF